MWKVSILLLALCVCIHAKGHAKKKHVKAHTSHAEWTDETQEDAKRDAIAQPVYSNYQQPQYPAAAKSSVPAAAAAVTSGYNKAAYASSTSYDASSTNSYTASQRAAVSSPPAAPAPAPAAPAQAAAAPAPAPAVSAPAPAPVAPAAPAAAPAPAAAYPSPAPAPAPVATPAAAPAPAPALAPAAPAPAPAAAPAASSSRSDFPSLYPQSSSYSSSFYINPPAQAPAPAPAPAYYAAAPAPAPAPAPAAQPASATTTVAAAVAQAATSTVAFSDLLKGKHDKSKIAKGVCMDDARADNFCRKANNPCFCEENHHFMYNYCKRSCSWCGAMPNVGHRYWRIVNSAVLPRSWIIKEIQFFTDKHAKKPIKVNPTKAYASTSYLGYAPSNAFDGNDKTYWLPEGWYERFPGMDYIGIEFPQPVVIGSVRVKHQSNEKNATSTKMYLEASDFYDTNYYKQFTMDNPRKKEDKRYTTVDCPIYWRRMEANDEVYCLKTITEFLNWQQARDKCASFGAELLSIDSPGENMFVNNELRLCGFTWIGLNDRKNESNFEWSDGTPMTFKSWAGDESYYEQDEYLNSKQNCVAASRTGEWRPFHCDNKFYSVCKMKLKAPDDDDEDMEKKGHYNHKRVSKKSQKGKSKHEDEDDDDEDASGNLDVETSGMDEDNSEDAIKEIKKNVKKAVKVASKKKKHDKTEEEEEDEDEDEDDEDSGSTAERTASTIPHRKEEIEKVDDTFLDLKH